MLRILVLGLAAAVVCLAAAPCQALINPAADVVFHPAATPSTSEILLNLQISGTYAPVSGAHSGDIPPPKPSDYYADSHTVVFGDLGAGSHGSFELPQFDPTRTLNNDGSTPITKLQGLLLFFTVQLKTGRHVFDNESSKAVTSALVEIGTQLRIRSVDKLGNYDPIVGVDCFINPIASKSGSLAPDQNGPYDGLLPKKPSQLTPAEIELWSQGLDKIAAIIDPNAPSSRDEVNAIKLDVTPGDTAILAAFTGTGTVRFDYASLLNTFHDISSQNVIGWTIKPTFDIEARVVYLYSAIPEPASLGLLAAFAPALLRRRRRRRTSLS